MTLMQELLMADQTDILEKNPENILSETINAFTTHSEIEEITIPSQKEVIPQNTEQPLLTSIFEVLQSLDMQVRTLKEDLIQENKELIASLETTENRLQRRDSEIQAYQEDFYRKTVSPYVRQFIVLADMMRKVIWETKATPEKCNNVYWQSQFQKTIQSIDFILNDFSFKVYQDAQEGETYNPERQDVVGYMETSQPELDKKICTSYNPGYVWTIPYIIRCKANGEPLPLKEHQIIFRKEQVITYKLK